MSHDPASSSVESRAAELRRTQEQQRQRIFISFAVIEGIILAIAILVIYVLELIDPALGVWVLIAIALVGGSLLSAYLVTSMRRNQRELADLTQS